MIEPEPIEMFGLRNRFDEDTNDAVVSAPHIAAHGCYQSESIEATDSTDSPIIQLRQALFTLPHRLRTTAGAKGLTVVDSFDVDRKISVKLQKVFRLFNADLSTILLNEDFCRRNLCLVFKEAALSDYQTIVKTIWDCSDDTELRCRLLTSADDYDQPQSPPLIHSLLRQRRFSSVMNNLSVDQTSGRTTEAEGDRAILYAVNATVDRMGFTPLMVAASLGDIPTCAQLLAYQTRSLLGSTDKHGLTAIDWALIDGNSLTANMLFESLNEYDRTTLFSHTLEQFGLHRSNDTTNSDNVVKFQRLCLLIMFFAVFRVGDFRCKLTQNYAFFHTLWQHMISSPCGCVSTMLALTLASVMYVSRAGPPVFQRRIQQQMTASASIVHFDWQLFRGYCHAKLLADTRTTPAEVRGDILAVTIPLQIACVLRPRQELTQASRQIWIELRRLEEPFQKWLNEYQFPFTQLRTLVSEIHQEFQRTMHEYQQLFVPSLLAIDNGQPPTLIADPSANCVDHHQVVASPSANPIEEESTRAHIETDNELVAEEEERMELSVPSVLLLCSSSSAADEANVDSGQRRTTSDSDDVTTDDKSSLELEDHTQGMQISSSDSTDNNSTEITTTTNSSTNNDSDSKSEKHDNWAATVAEIYRKSPVTFLKSGSIIDDAEALVGLVTQKVNCKRFVKEHQQLQSLPDDSFHLIGDATDENRFLIKVPKSEQFDLGRGIYGERATLALAKVKTDENLLVAVREVPHNDTNSFCIKRLRGFLTNATTRGRSDLINDHLLRYREYECSETTWYMAREVCDWNLDQYMDEIDQGRLSPENPCRIVIQMFRGLEYLHTKTASMYHGNMKPNNLLIDSHRTLRLVDFAFGKMCTVPYGFKGRCYDPSNGHYHAVCWKPPEYYRLNETYSRESDIHSAAMLTHYILTKKRLHPFVGMHRDMMRADTLKALVTRGDSNIDSGLCASARDLISKGLAVERTERMKIKDVVCHPLFWSDSKRRRFLTAIALGLKAHRQQPTDAVACTPHSQLWASLEQALSRSQLQPSGDDVSTMLRRMHKRRQLIVGDDGAPLVNGDALTTLVYNQCRRFIPQQQNSVNRN